MVKVSDDVRRTWQRFWDLVHGRVEPRNDLEEEIQGEQSVSESGEEESEGERTYGAFELTADELRGAVKEYREWLGDVRAEIAHSKERISGFKETAQELSGEAARDAKFDLQLEVDKLNELKDERDEVEAKLQTLRRELNNAETEERRRERQRRDPLDWMEYDRREQEDSRREQRKRRQKEQQAVRHMRNQQRFLRNTESADLSDAEEVLGEEEADEIREVMSDEFEAMENDWLDQSDGDGDESVEQLN